MFVLLTTHSPFHQFDSPPHFLFEEWLQRDSLLSFSHYFLPPPFISFGVNLNGKNVIFVGFARLQRCICVNGEQAKRQVEAKTGESQKERPSWVGVPITDFPGFSLNLLVICKRSFQWRQAN